MNRSAYDLTTTIQCVNHVIQCVCYCNYFQFNSTIENRQTKILANLKLTTINRIMLIFRLRELFLGDWPTNRPGRRLIIYIIKVKITFQYIEQKWAVIINLTWSDESSEIITFLLLFRERMLFFRFGHSFLYVIFCHLLEKLGKYGCG